MIILFSDGLNVICLLFYEYLLGCINYFFHCNNQLILGCYVVVVVFEVLILDSIFEVRTSFLKRCIPKVLHCYSVTARAD